MSHQFFDIFREQWTFESGRMSLSLLDIIFASSSPSEVVRHGEVVLVSVCKKRGACC